MSRWLPAGILGLWCGCGFFSLPVAANEPWDAAPFSAPAADIRRAADGLESPKTPTSTSCWRRSTTPSTSRAAGNARPAR